MKEFLSNLKFAWKFAKGERAKLIKYILCNICMIIISVIVPIISAQIIISLTDSLFQQLLFLAVILCLVEWSRNFFNRLSMYYSQVIYRETFISLQTELGKEIMRLETSVIDKHGSGVFIQRLTNDTSRLASVFNILNQYLSNILTDIGIFVAMFIINFWAFLYMLIVIVILFLLERKRTNLYNESDKKFRKENEKVSSFVGEIIRGIRDIKMLHAEDSFSKELHKQVEELNLERYEMSAVKRRYVFKRAMLRDLFDMGLIFLLVYLILEGGLIAANALVIHNYAVRVPNIVWSVGILLDSIKDFNLSCERVFNIMYGSEYKKERFGSKHLAKVHGDFCFSHVNFDYEESAEVLKDLSFQVHANETVAFVGKSGAGKSTIFSLLCKLYPVDSGVITIDGTDINDLDQESIRGNITVISQNPYIFHVSIKDNLRLMKSDITEKEMIKACKLACIHDFIMELPDGYDTIVGEGGVNLSGGQRQRLAIARAFLQKTEIILFDEATSSLDNETQKEIQKAINNLKKNYTILIIAHRLSTIINSDRILFIESGQVVAEGTHKQLLKNCLGYKELYEAELKDKV